MPSLQRIHTAQSWPLHGVEASRALERHAQAGLAPHTLMQRAGLAVARLARAIAPHARSVWIACGPGNNGGDGFEAALHLHRLGWHVTLTWTPAPHSPPDAQASRERALAAGMAISDAPPQDFGLAIDALLGLGGDLSPQRSGSAQMLQWLQHMHASGRPVLAVDLPTGLDADTGAAARRQASSHLSAATRHTLSLLSLKPGLFTAEGRDHAGQVWFDDLGVDGAAVAPDAWLAGADLAGDLPRRSAPQASHKGSFGDVVVVGGEQGRSVSMAGAALLAARAALHHGAGRVYVCLLGSGSLQLDAPQPELMFRPPDSLAGLTAAQAVVAGCGGGGAVADALPRLMAHAGPLVLDADALNALASSPALQQALRARSREGLETVLTPHPLEAARLLGCSAAEVQTDRLQAARRLADGLGCTVALKGSGTVIATPGELPAINASGNVLLATAGTGDVLAGMVGAAMAQGLAARAAALQAVFEHGRIADDWAQAQPGRVLTASALLQGGSPRVDMQALRAQVLTRRR